jgi:hypothetical protein
MPGPPTMFESAPAAPPPQDGYIQPTLGDGLRIWWAYWWPTFLLSTLATVLTNLFLRSVYSDTIVPGWLRGPVLRFDSYFFTYFLGYFMLALVLRKDFRRFRIGLLSNHGGPGAEILSPSFRRTARVWWTFTWRCVVYRIIVAAVVSFPLSWIVGFLTAIFRDVPAVPSLIMFLVGVAFEAVVGLFVIYSNILDEDISDFRVALLPRSVPAAVFADTAPPANIPAS